MKIITIDESNIENEHICCAIGGDAESKRRVQTKKDWMKREFPNGLVFKRFDGRGKFFIEYMPIETCWKPVSGENWLVIHCLWVSGQFKNQGLGKELLESCISDAKEKGKSGIAYITSKTVQPFLTDKKFFLHYGFEVVDSAPPYFELLALRLNPESKTPRFMDHVRIQNPIQRKGFTFTYSHQCPFMEDYVEILTTQVMKRDIPVDTLYLNSADEAQHAGSPFATLGIYYNNDFRTHELMPEKKFEAFIDQVTGKSRKR